MAKLWNAANNKPHPLIEAYTVGDDYQSDMILMPYDIEGSKAHAKGLAKIGILTEEELKKLLEGLDNLMKKWKKGTVQITVEDEDCHTVIENFLTEQYGEIGKKIHTARSRNDQSVTAIRLYMKAVAEQLADSCNELIKSFESVTKKYGEVPLPGYTHMQQAMMSSVGLWLGSFTESLHDDVEFLHTAKSHIDKNPLGSAAGYGTSFPVDKEFTAREMGFAKVQKNPLYCQAGRGKFESVFLEALCQIMMTLGKFASDMLFFTSQECAFFDIPTNLTTGSSIMPQKKNLDGLEILRANVSVVIGYQNIIKNICTGLISGYNRDLQLTKKYLFESVQITSDSIGVAKLYLEGLTPNTESINAKITPEIFLAEKANELVREKGISFRSAYDEIKSQMNNLPIDIDASKL